jgi:hypothetical protein
MAAARIFSIVVLAALLTSACGYERRTGEVFSPSAVGSGTPAAPAFATAMTGVWTGQNVAPPASSSCSNFQWQIVSQTATSIAGTFSAVCASGLSVSGSASGQLVNGVVSITVTGTAVMPGIPSCGLSLSGTGTLEDNNTALRVSYSGTTCLGAVSGTEVLRRAGGMSV